MDPDLAHSLEPLHRDAYGWARHCCGDSPIDPGDILQSAYLKVIEGRTRPRDPVALKTWWFGVIRYTAREERRRRRFRDALAGKLLRFAPTVEPATAPSPIERDETAAELRRAVATLPERQAEVLHLVFYQDHSLSEAAAVMGVSLGTARTHYQRAKARLRERLSDSPER